MNVNLETRVIDLTLGELLAALDCKIKEVVNKTDCNSLSERKIIYGLLGIAKTLGCHTSTVNRMKRKGVFKGYLSQMGKTITAYEDDIIQAGKEYFKKTQIKKEKELNSIKKPSRLRSRR